MTYLTEKSGLKFQAFLTICKEKTLYCQKKTMVVAEVSEPNLSGLYGFSVGINEITIVNSIVSPASFYL
jgi:hypothetical protein